VYLHESPDEVGVEAGFALLEDESRWGVVPEHFEDEPGPAAG
jgi:hypothetical protein